MKTLLIGIDGADESIFDLFDMPNLRSLRTMTSSIAVEEDLHSRGWAKMLTGLHPSITGACYERPALDGSFAFTQKCGRHDLEIEGYPPPLWKLLNNAKISVGFLNVPTTMPAPDCHGFFVAGAGGGLGSLGSGFPKGFVNPLSVANVLQECAYVPDIRFRSSGIRDIEEWFTSLTKMMNRRTEAFIRLCRIEPIDFGCIAYMATSRMQNLAMCDIELIREGVGSPIETRIRRLYRALDDQLGRLVEKLDPELIIIAGDHAAAPMKSIGNLNRFLQEGGFQPQSWCENFATDIVEPRLPVRQRYHFRKRMIKLFGPLSRPGSNRIRAFGHRYINGIFINDHRFSGVVQNVSATVEEVCAFLNTHHQFAGNGMKARPYREHFSGSRCVDLLPDIWVDKPDTVFFLTDGPAFGPNPFYHPIIDLSEVSHDLYSGAKGRNPMVWATNSLAQGVAGETPRDLRIVYYLVKRSFGL